MRNEFYKDTQGAILVYDVSDRSSFEALDRWMEELNSEIGIKSEVDSIVVCVCANKVSHVLEKRVSSTKTCLALSETQEMVFLYDIS